MTAFDLRGVTVVDTADGSLSHDMTVVVDGPHIAHVAPSASIGQNGRRSIDAAGAYVVPGFIEAHAHPLNSSDPAGYLAMMLAHGITGVRQMSGTPDHLAQRRAGTLMPHDDTPELLEMPGEILTRANAATPERVVAEIRKQADAGADFIKVIDVDRPTFFAGLEECNRLGLRYIGHLPPVVDVRQAATAGMRSIEHLGPRDAFVLACSTEEQRIREEIDAQPAPPRPLTAGPVPDHVVRRAISLPTLQTGPAEFQRYRREIDSFSEAKRDELAAHLAAAGTWQVPTLIRVRTMQFADDTAYTEDPNLKYVPSAVRQMWQELTEQFEAKLETEQRAVLRELFGYQVSLVKPMLAAGVPMMAGSDTGGAWIIPGTGLHREFDLLAGAGLTPLQILQMTTRNVAAFLGRTQTMGSVAEGNGADLVLLDGNPVADVAHLHAIGAVVRGGRYYSRADLDALKKRTADRQHTWAPSPDALHPPACC